jgi:predicted  nucleic acid-binding Zn-ribbon protein
MTIVTSTARIVGGVGSWRTERRLTQVATRLRSLRAELAVIDEQLAHLADEADDLALRALVAETPSTSQESAEARKHVDAMRKHCERVVAEIAQLEVRQDELLDRLTRS